MIILLALRRVFQKIIYLFIAIVATILIFSFAVWLPNISLIVKIMGHQGISLSQRFYLPINLLGSITTNFSPLSASYTIAIAILFGLNLAMTIYFLKRRIVDVEQSGIATGLFGMASGVIGMGCAACGSLLLTSILSLFGATWTLSFLPFSGGEFGILGVVLLAISIYMTAKRIQNPAVCSIN